MSVPVGKKASELEAWENVSRSRYALRRINSVGQLETELIGGHKTFHLTTQERYMNSERAASARSDPFRNGRFAPVRLLETTEDAEEIAANPNLLGESDMVELVKGKIEPLRARLEEIQQPVVVERMLEVAEREDARMTSVKAIQKRIEDLRPETHVEVMSQDDRLGGGSIPARPADAPRSGSPLR